MAIRAVVFDIGGVLENTPDLGVRAEWEARLGLEPGGLDRRLDGVWRGGGVGALTEEEVHARVGEILELDAARVDAFMADVWREYLGTLNVELVEYFRGLRPRFRTGILSNSFVGARRREQDLYGFEELCDVIVYSQRAGTRSAWSMRGISPESRHGEIRRPVGTRGGGAAPQRSGDTTRSEPCSGWRSRATRRPMPLWRTAMPVGYRMCVSVEEPQLPPR